MAPWLYWCMERRPPIARHGQRHPRTKKVTAVADGGVVVVDTRNAAPLYFLDRVLGTPNPDWINVNFFVGHLHLELAPCLHCQWIGVHRESCHRYGERPFRTGLRSFS